MDSSRSSALSPELIQLAQQIDFAQDEFALYLAQVNSPVQRGELIVALKEMLLHKGITTAEIACDENTRDLLTIICEALDTLEPVLPVCILVTGLERSIKRDDPNPPLLAHLNLARELYRNHVPHPLVLWLPEYALTALARIAPDFWAWRSGVFEFEPAQIAVKAEDGSTAIGLTQVAGDYYATTPAPTRPTAPVPPAYFTGRHDELDALAQALTTGDTPQAITALQGMGGIGKTALAAQLAVQLNGAFPGGVFWADLLADGGDPLPVLAAWARLCGHDVSAMPDPQARAQAVRGILANRVNEQGQLLIILDDVRSEWLDGARLLLVARPPGVPLLLMTRDVRVAHALGARITRLDVLPLEQSLALLTTLAGPVVKREPDAARYLAERLGGLPLALELAGRLAALYTQKPGWSLASLGEIIEARADDTLRLGQRGLAATFSLSYEVLDAEGQRLFRALSVFAPAPFGAEHVAAVLEHPVEAVEKGLDALVALGMVSWEQGREERSRYIMHPLLRDYASTLLERVGEGPVARAAHTAHYLTYAEAHNQPTRADYDALEAELPNILLAMDRAYLEKQWAQVRRFMWALSVTRTGSQGYLWVRGNWYQLRTRLEQAIRAATAEGNKHEAAAFAGNLAALLYRMGDLQAARKEYYRVLVILEDFGAKQSTAVVYHQLGGLAQDTGDYAEARRLYQHSLTIEEELGNQAGVASTLHGLGLLAQATGDYSEAQHLYQRSLEIEEQLGNQAGIARTLHNLGRLAQAMGNYTEALHLYRRSLDINEEVGDQTSVASTLHQLGRLAQATGEYNEARRLYRQSLDIKEELGNRAGIASTLHQLGMLAQATGEYDEARRLYRQSLDINEELGNRAGIASTLHNLAALAQATGEYDEARRLYRQSLDINEELGNRTGISITLGQLANLADLEGNLAEAERQYSQAIDILRELGDLWSESIILFNLALLYETQGRLAESLPLLQRSSEIKERLGSPLAGQDRQVLERVQRKLQT